ncbi:MAG: hypothetical protein ACRD4Q_07840 [Candidatus Acidiferrales bacterium]
MEKTSAVGQWKAWVTEHRSDLKQAGIATIAASYSGAGDEGRLDYVEFLDPEGNSAEPFQDDIVRELFEALHEELAPAGYEISEGGGGEFMLNVATGVLTHESYSLSTERYYNPAEEY